MPAKPTKLPVWGKTTAPITEPSAAFQGAGYVEGDKPAADHLNFLFTAFSEWVTDWLDATFDDDGFPLAEIEHPLSIAALGFLAPDGAAIDVASDYGIVLNLLGSTGFNTFSIPVRVGDVITGYAVHLNKASGSGTISARLRKITSTKSITAVDTQSTAAASPGNISLSATGLSETVASGVGYQIEIAGGGTSGDVVYSLSYTTARA